MALERAAHLGRSLLAGVGLSAAAAPSFAAEGDPSALTAPARHWPAVRASAHTPAAALAAAVAAGAEHKPGHRVMELLMLMQVLPAQQAGGTSKLGTSTL